LSREAPKRECEFQERLSDGRVNCHICPHECKISDGQVGVCLCRRNFGGTLRPINYAEVTSLSMDPIEKKPLYHFFPGSDILSIGTWGCNFKCDFCQNWQISQQAAPTEHLEPEEVVKQALDRRSVGIAYTYNEPTIWFEYVWDTGRLARQAGLKNVLVTNGYVNPAPLEKLLEVVDAMNIDIKGFTEGFYKKHAKGRLAPVLETARLAARRCHVETTTLLLPGENDSKEEITLLRDWIYDNLGPDSPTHVSAYFPRYKSQAPETPLESLIQARKILAERLRFVYVGNVVTPGVGNTKCFKCGATAVRRSGYTIDAGGLKDGSCGACGQKLNFVVS
jgi:pyruvate formate lyase activating enzyme